MTRDEIKTLFPDATDEQVTKLLNQHQSELSKEKTKTQQYKDDASKVAELQKQLDEINDAKLSEVERANKETENANKTVADLQKQIAQMKVENELAKLGITEKLLNDDGSVDFSVLGDVLSTREKNAVAEYEKKALENTDEPGSKGGSGKDGEDGEKSNAEKMAESIAKTMGGSASSDIVNAYA